MVKELKRKTLHVLIGTLLITACIQINTVYGLRAVTIALLTVAILSLITDYLLSCKKIKLSIYKKLQRSQEKQGIHHHTFALISITITSLFITPINLLVAAAILTYGDAAAALVGKYFGKHKLVGKKTMEGSMAMLVVSISTSTLILGPTFVAFLTALASTIAEATSSNDALTIPITAGLTATVLSLMG